MNNNMEKEVSVQFEEFLKTKGIKAKFKLAFENMKESARVQHEKDVKQFNEIKAKSAEENKDFVEFLHTKGIKAKAKLVIENIKKGARESREKTKEQIAKANELGRVNHKVNNYSASDLSKEFNEFLKQKGLSEKFVLTIEEITEE